MADFGRVVWCKKCDAEVAPVGDEPDTCPNCGAGPIWFVRRYRFQIASFGTVNPYRGRVVNGYTMACVRVSALRERGINATAVAESGGFGCVVASSQEDYDAAMTWKDSSRA